LLTGNGEDVKVTQELMRHANPNTTLALYSQAIPEHVRNRWSFQVLFDKRPGVRLVRLPLHLAGLLLSGGGLLLLFLMPLVGTLTGKIQACYLIGFGWLALSIAMFYTTRTLDLQISFRHARMLRILGEIAPGQSGP
jgi:hypothetical protein